MDGSSASKATEVRQRFEELLALHQRAIFKVAGTYSASPEERRDLAQEIAIQLWKAFPSYDPERAFFTWMYRIALNVAISFMRGAGLRRRHSVPLDETHVEIEDVGAADPEAREELRVLHRFIQGLGALDRALLLLYLEERSYREIGEVLGITETNVQTRIHRLKKRIREGLAAPSSK